MIHEIYRECGWYFCGNHLHRDDAGTSRSYYWRTVPQTGELLCPEHSHLLDADRRVKAGAR